MVSTADRLSVAELDQLAALLAESPLNRTALIETFRRFETGLAEHGRELDDLGGLLDEHQKAARMSLAREDERLRQELSSLLVDVGRLEQAASGRASDDDVRQRATALLAGLRGHRDAEVSLVLESVNTDVGAGD